MEALILILIEAFGAVVPAAVGGFFALLGSVISSLFALVLDLVMWRLTGTQKTTTIDRTTDANPIPTAPPVRETLSVQPGTHGTVTAATPSPRRPRRRWSRWVLIAASSMTALVLITLVVINQWFIDDFARWLLDKQRARSGIAITAETIDGNLFTGRFQATGITVKRSDHPAGLIDLTVRRIDVSIAVWQVFAKPLIVESITVDGVQGRFERGIPGQAPAAEETKKPLTVAGVTVEHDGDTTTFTLERPSKPKRTFIISDLTIANVEVTYADHTSKRPLTIPVTISRLTANPLRSQWAVLDVLFRANATGTVAGRPLTITTTGDDLGRDTQWTIDGLPIEILADQVGGPFALLSAGTADVHVTDHWRNSDDERIIVMDWQVVLNHVTAEVPENTSKFMALLAKPAVAFINAKGDRVPLSFRVEIDEDRFDGAASAEAAGLWQVVGDSAAATLAKMLGIKTDTVKDVGETALDAAKAALEKWRKKKKQE